MVTRLAVPYLPSVDALYLRAACLQMMLAHQGIRISHLRATRELEAFPDGTDLGRLQSVYERLSGKG